jgi:autotransporter-associated beta strand protein
MLNITGGTFNTGRFDGIASGGTNATAVIYVGGAGTPTLNQNVGDYFLLMRTNGQTEMTVGPGGSFTRQAAVSNAFNITMDGTNSYGVFNVAGGTVDAGPAKGLTFGFGAPGTGNVGMVNVAGGSLNLGANTALGATAGATAVYFNFTGGTLKANAALTGVIPANNAGITLTSTLFGPVTNNNNANTAFNTQVGASSNFTGGLMVDTNGNAVTLSNPLLGAATSYAVTQAAIGDVSLKAGNSGYIGAPMVTFSAPSGGGVPASGYALISGGVVTGIVITDPGTYALNEQPTITLSGGGGTIAPFTTAALATLNGAGGITKIGAGTLTVTNATSTYTGGVTINQGTFALGINSAIPSANNVTVSGGVLDMLTFNNTVATVSLQSGTIQGSTGVLTATNTYDLQSGTVNFSSTGSLAGSVGATKSGAGTVTLLSANTFSGAVNVNGGVLSFSNPNQLGNASVTNTIGFNGGILSYSGTTSQALGANRVVTINAGGGTFDVPNLVGTLTVTAGISNTSTGNLTKTGAGSVIIPGNGVNAVNLGSGSVNVSAGTLQAGFNTSGASAVSVGATGNLNMTNGAAEVLTLSSNATGALTLASGATLGFELNGTSNDEIIVGGATGTASVGTTSPITLNFTPIGSGVVANTYTLLSSANGGLDPSGATYSLGTGLPGGFNYSLSVTDNLVQLMAVTFAPIYWTNSQGNGSWATLNGGTLSNFSTDSAGATNNAAIPIASNTVIFNASSVTGTTVTSTLDGLYTIYSLQFENIGGTSTVTAVNVNPGSGGTITIAPGAAIGGIDVGNNAGTITINAGVGVVASNSNNAAQTWNVDGTGTSSLTVNGNVTFAASVTKTGNGALTLAGTNTGSGNFTLSGGTVNANSNGALGTGIFTVAAGTTIGNTSAGAVTLANSSHVWNGNFTSAGTQALNLGTAPVIMGASLTATVNNTLIVGGVIDDGINTYSLTKAGTGALTLSGANTYGGGTTLSAGTLNINSTTAIGSGAFTLGGGTFDTTNVNTTLTTNNPVLWTNGASVAFTGTKTLNLGTGAVTFGNDATVSSFTITNNSVLAGTSLTFGGNITSGIGGTAGIKTLTVAGTGDTALNGSITTGTAAGLVLVKNGASNLTIGGAASLFENNVGTSLLTLNGGTVTIASGATLTLNNSGTSGIGGTGGTINGPGTIVLASGTAGNYQDWNGTTTINAKITGAFGIDFYNSGTMTLTNTSSDFTGSPDLGPTTVSVAVIGNSGSTSPLGTNGTINFTFSTSTTGKLIYTGTGETSNKVIALAGTTAGGVGTIDQSGTGPLKFTANLTAGAATHTLVLQGSPANPAVATGEIAGIIKDNSGTFNTAVNKLGTSTWILSALNSYTGITTIAGGILTTGPGGILANGGVASSIGQSTNVAANLVLNGGTLQYANTGAAESTDRLFTLGTGGGTLDASGTSPITFAGNGANALAYAGTTTRTLTLTGSNTGANTLAPILADATGATSLSKTGAGTWLVTGLSTFTGPTTISGGVLSTGTSGILANGGTASSIGKSTNVAANLVLNGGTLQYANTGAAESTDRLFTLGTGGGTLDASGTNAITFAGNGANAIAYAGTTTRTLTLTGSNTGNNTLAPILADATGATSLSKTGAGTWLVTGLNTFTGATGISAGTLAVNAVATGASAQPLGKNTGANAVTLGVASTSSGVLKYTGGVGSLDKNITAVGNGGDAIVNAGSGALTLSGTLTKNGTVLTLNGGTNGIHVTGTIVGIGPGSDLVADTGLTFLDNANTYNGPTFIRNGGTLNATVAGALPTSPRSAVTMDDIGSGTSTLGLTASQSIASLTGATTSVGTISNTNTLTVGTTSGRTTFAGGISGAGGFTKDGASTQVLGGVNGYTGATAVNAGNLVVNGSLASGSTVTVADLATIDGKGTVQGSLTLTSGAQNLGAPTTSGGTIAAGDGAVGKLTVASATFGSAAPVTGQQTTYNWKFTNADATNGLGTNAGTFYDTLSITTLSVTGAVDVIASAISPVQLDPTLTYQFKIISGTGSGDTNSAATQFHLDNSSYAAFQSANLATTAADYSFSGDTSGDVFINYNAAPEPTSMMLLGLGVGGLALRRRRRTVKSSTLSM